jgi:hypothetical protein
MALETQGYQFQAPIPDLSREHPLSSLKALTFSGGGNSPLNLQPLAGWKVESAHPENVAIGAIQGAGAIGQGITAAYMSKQAKKEAADKLKKAQDREDSLLGQKYKEEEKIAGIRGSASMELLRERMAVTNPKGGVPADYGDDAGDYGSSEKPDWSNPVKTEAVPEKYIRDATPLKGGSFESINLPEEEDATGGSFNLKNGSPPLGDITSPVDISAAPSPRGENALSALASVDWSKVQGNLGASTGAGATPMDISAQAPDWLRKPKVVTSEISKLGGFSDQALPNTEKYLADIGEAYAKGEAAPTPSEKSSGGVPKAAFKSYAEAQKYIDSQSDNPKWYAEGAPKPDKFGNFVIPWKHHDPVAMAAKEEAQATRKEASQSRQDIQRQNTLNREGAMFQSHPAVKAFTGLNGMQQSLPRFIKDYDAIVKNPEGAGISDVGLLDMFARAEGGGRVTEGQANLALGSMGLKDKAMQLGYKLEGGDRLSQNQRDQMLRVISEDHNVQVSLANQAVQMTRQKLMDQGITNEHSLPQPYIKAKTKWEGLDEITEMKKNALAIHEQQKQAEASGDKKTANDLKRQLEDIGKSAKELRSKIDKSKSAIINIDELENTPQGWGGGASGILIQQ